MLEWLGYGYSCCGGGAIATSHPKAKSIGDRHVRLIPDVLEAVSKQMLSNFQSFLTQGFHCLKAKPDFNKHTEQFKR